MGSCVTQVSISTILYTGGSGRTGRKRNIMACGDMSANQGITNTDRNSKVDEHLKRVAQQAFEEKYGHERWMKEFGRNYLEE